MSKIAYIVRKNSHTTELCYNTRLVMVWYMHGCIRNYYGNTGYPVRTVIRVRRCNIRTPHLGTSCMLVTLYLCLICVCVFLKVLHCVSRKGGYMRTLLFTLIYVRYAVMLLNLQYKTTTFPVGYACMNSEYIKTKT